MDKPEDPLIIIGNESNSIYHMEPDRESTEPDAATTSQPSGDDEPAEQWNEDERPQRPSNDLATNDGSILETLDTALHQKPGVAEGLNPSGSNRADYYEERSYGQSDAEEERPATENY